MRTQVNREKVEKLRAFLFPGDVDHLWHAVEFCGGFAGQPFKGLLISTLKAGYDDARTSRLAAVIKRLNEAEILWLCDHSENERPGAEF